MAHAREEYLFQVSLHDVLTSTGRRLMVAVFHLRVGDEYQHQVDLFHATTKPRAITPASAPALYALGRCSTYQDRRAKGDPCPIRRPHLDLRKIAAACPPPNFISIGEGSTPNQQAPQSKSNGHRAKNRSEQVVSYWLFGAYQDSTSKEWPIRKCDHRFCLDSSRQCRTCCSCAKSCIES